MTAPVSSVCRLEGDHQRCSDGAAIVRGDALRLPFGDESVDLIVTSPPYFQLRSYQDGGEHYDGQIGSEPTPAAFLEALWAVTAECWRVLKPSGSLFVNLGDKYAGSGGHNNGGIAKPDKKRKGWDGANNPMATAANATRRSAPDRYNQASDGIRPKSLMGLPWRYAIGCIDGQADPDGVGWILRSELVWSKPNGLPESVRDRVRRSHEQWFHLTKSGRYYADMDVVREETQGRQGLTWDERKAMDDGANSVARYSPNNGHAGSGGMAGNPLGKLPDSVWTIATQPLIVPDELGVDHFAAFPTEWPRRIITAWSPPGICTACGEGRRSVSRKRTSGKDRGGVRARHVPGMSDIDRSDWNEGVTYEVLGTACACPDTSAPTTPAVVLDPFGGTGTTAMVARALGRYGVSVDLSADYLRLAHWRIFDSDGADKVRARHEGRTYKPPKPETPGQMSLMEALP